MRHVQLSINRVGVLLHGRVRRFLAVLAAAAALPQPALADSFDAWQKHTTDKGCILYQFDMSVGGMETDPNPTGYIWIGTCTPGQSINGEGTLVAQVNSGGIQYIYTTTGRVTNGLFEGSVRLDYYEFGPGGPSDWTLNADWGVTRTYLGGCPTDSIYEHGCQPNNIEGAINIPRVTVPYYPLPPGFMDAKTGGTASASGGTAVPGEKTEKPAIPPKRKVGTLTHVLALGNACISVRMLPYNPQENQALDEIELKNDCSTPQIITNYVQTDGSFTVPLQYIHGPPYYVWRGKYPPVLPQSVIWEDPHGTFTMWPGNVTTASFPGGRNITIKTAACDYTGPDQVINKIYTAVPTDLQGFSMMICVPNPEQPPKESPF